MTKASPTLNRRLKNIQGQIGGIIKMLDDERECLAILPQLKAARAGFDTAIALFIEENLVRCLGKQCADNAKLKVLLGELFK